MSPHYPQIQVFCPCSEPATALAGATASHNTSRSSPSSPSVGDREDTDESSTAAPESIWLDDARHNLETLYFCDYCETLRCPRCVQEEVISRYCPNCLFEVTSQTAKADENTCSRNCFQCPSCYSSTKVVSRKRSNQDEAPTYELSCNHCGWGSSDHGMIFDRQPSLTSQVSELEKARTTRFRELKKYYHEQAVSELTTDDVTLRKKTASSVGKILDKKKKNKNPLKIETQELDESEDYDITNTTNQLPIRRRLRSKRLKRCIGCRQILVKPESKPTSTGFRIRQLAMNHLPSFTITQHNSASSVDPEIYPSVLGEGKTHTFRLTVYNPMNTPIKVNLATLPTTHGEHPHKVTIVSPTVELGAASELWDEVSLVRGVPAAFMIRQTNTAKKVFMEGDRETGIGGGIYERGKNWVTVLMEVVPSAMVKKVQIPLFVSYWYHRSNKSQEEEEADDNGDDDEDDNRVNIGFWTTVVLGETQEGLVKNPVLS